MTPTQSARPDHRTASASHRVIRHPTAFRLMAGAQVSRFGAIQSRAATCVEASAQKMAVVERVAGLPLAGQRTGNATCNPKRMAAACVGVTAGETAPNSNPPVTAIPRDDERAACASPHSAQAATFSRRRA